MTVIYKYRINLTPTQILELPQGAQILHVGEDTSSTDICVWAAVDPTTTQMVRVPIYVLGTGMLPFPAEPLRHLGSVKQGVFIWHIFTTPAVNPPEIAGK